MASKNGFLSGALWSSVNALAGIALPFVIFILFARVLPPEQVGVVALAIAWAEIVKTFGLTGFYEALLQQKHDLPRCHETAALVFLTAGVVLLAPFAAIMWLTAQALPGVARNFWLLCLIGLRIPFDLAAMQPLARLAQDLAYRRMGLRSVFGNLLAGLAGVGIAFAADPLVGLVVYQVGQSGLVLLITLMGGTAARPRLHVDCFRRLRHEGLMATSVRVVAVCNNQADQVIVAGLLGSLQLAYFNLAKRLEGVFSAVSNSFTSILFQPMFASQEAGSREAGFRRGLAFLTMSCGLAAAVFVVNAGPVIQLVFGAKWLPAAPVASVLAINGFMRALGGVHAALLSVSNRNRQLLMISGSMTVAGLAATVGAAPLGLMWCAAALTLKTAVALFLNARATRGEFVHLGRAYLVEVVGPFALMLAGAALGRWGGASVLTGTGLLPDVGIVAVSGVVALACCAGYFGHRFSGLLRAARRPAAAAQVQ